jgi:hypothetical protein
MTIALAVCAFRRVNMTNAAKIATERGRIAPEGWALVSVSRHPEKARVVLRRPPGQLRRYKSLWLTVEPVEIDGWGWIRIDPQPPVNAYGAEEPRVLFSETGNYRWQPLKLVGQ